GLRVSVPFSFRLWFSFPLRGGKAQRKRHGFRPSSDVGPASRVVLSLTRRRLVATSATALAFSGYARLATGTARAADDGEPGYGPLRPDPLGVFDLPEGFSYRIVSQVGETMDDGL